MNPTTLLSIFLIFVIFYCLFNFTLVEGFKDDEGAEKGVAVAQKAAKEVEVKGMIKRALRPPPLEKPKGGLGSDAWEKMSDEEGKKLARLDEQKGPIQMIKDRKTGKIRIASPEEIKMRKEYEKNMVGEQIEAEKKIAQQDFENKKRLEEQQAEEKKRAEKKLEDSAKNALAAAEDGFKSDQLYGAGAEVGDSKTPSSQCAEFIEQRDRLAERLPCEKRCAALYENDKKFLGSICEQQICRCKFNQSENKKDSLKFFYKNHGNCKKNDDSVPMGSA